MKTPKIQKSKAIIITLQVKTRKLHSLTRKNQKKPKKKKKKNGCKFEH